MKEVTRWPPKEAGLYTTVRFPGSSHQETPCRCGLEDISLYGFSVCGTRKLLTDADRGQLWLALDANADVASATGVRLQSSRTLPGTRVAGACQQTVNITPLTCGGPGLHRQWALDQELQNFTFTTYLQLRCLQLRCLQLRYLQLRCSDAIEDDSPSVQRSPQHQMDLTGQWFWLREGRLNSGDGRTMLIGPQIRSTTPVDVHSDQHLHRIAGQWALGVFYNKRMPPPRNKEEDVQPDSFCVDLDLDQPFEVKWMYHELLTCKGSSSNVEVETCLRLMDRFPDEVSRELRDWEEPYGTLTARWLTR